jgi:hypothetical protein
MCLISVRFQRKRNREVLACKVNAKKNERDCEAALAITQH